MCGNGIRCLAAFLADLEGDAKNSDQYRIHTLAGVITPQLMSDGQVKVDMGIPKLLAGEIPTTLTPSKRKSDSSAAGGGGENLGCHLCQYGESSLYYLCR
jgi:diaminopimelate epimerase